MSQMTPKNYGTQVFSNTFRRTWTCFDRIEKLAEHALFLDLPYGFLLDIFIIVFKILHNKTIR